MSNNGKKVDDIRDVIKGVEKGTVKQIDFNSVDKSITVYPEVQPKEKL